MFEYNNGVRDHYEYTDAMFVNSLFKDFLMENRLSVWKEESTRDIICLEFNYGSRSYREEMNHLHKVAMQAMEEYQRAKLHHDLFLIEKAYNKRKKVIELIQTAHRNKDKYISLTNEELRMKYYLEGVNVTYTSYKKNGTERKRETIHYKMLYRSTGKAKKGSCMFIRDYLYKKSINFLRMGIEPDNDNPMIVEMSAYAPLVSSGIVGKVQIHPENILILKDIDSFFKTNVISIETDEQKHCIAKRINDYTLSNTLFDGQALIDSSIFPSWGNGYILLRHHFCKMAAFNANIQKFFRDYFGDQYDTATVTDMFGIKHYVKDIELITTDNAMKWIKFNKSYEYWCDWVNANHCMFGVVKTAHESKLGNYQRMSYQMVNSLDESIMENVVKESVDYITKLKTDTDCFLKFLEKGKNFSNDYDVLIALYKHNPEFKRSSYFRSRRKKIIEAYSIALKSGQLLQNAENLTIVGSPYAMLLYGATGDVDIALSDSTFDIECGTIQCYTERFDDKEYLAFFRSPFNSKNNLTYLHNKYDFKFQKYFNFGKQVIAVNMIGTDFQDRNNGADQDSDFGYTTNQPDIVNHARMCYLNYPTIVNNVPKDTNKYANSMESYARVDNALARSQTDIGESSNLAQIAQTYACNFDDPKYDDYVCILSTIAQIAIDSAKRRFDMDSTAEIKRIKQDMDLKRNKYPKFWGLIKYGFNKKNIDEKLHCPMNYLYDLNLGKYRHSSSTLPMTDFFIKHPIGINRKTSKRIEEMIAKYSLSLTAYNANNNNDYYDTEWILLRSDFYNLVTDIRNAKISGRYVGLMSWLLDRALNITPNVSRNRLLKTKLNTNQSLLLKVLYEVNPKIFLECFKKA